MPGPIQQIVQDTGAAGKQIFSETAKGVVQAPKEIASDIAETVLPGTGTLDLVGDVSADPEIQKKKLAAKRNAATRIATIQSELGALIRQKEQQRIEKAQTEAAQKSAAGEQQVAAKQKQRRGITLFGLHKSKEQRDFKG